MSNRDDGGMRAAFERWMSDDGKWLNAIQRNDKGDYVMAVAVSAWTTWQAAWIAARKEPAGDGYRREAADLYAALEPFTKHCSSDETITITVRTADVRRARAALSRASGLEADR